jgi:UDP-N-acetylglucosamine 2-epimerase (non-hydrolysing)
MVEQLKIISIVGARPNFMKIAPFIKAINKLNKSGHGIIEHVLVHTGQHYDANMSDDFFKVLNIPKPDINLGIGSGTHAQQVGNTMIELEKVIHDVKPDWVIVVGDVNATLAASVTAKKEHIKVAHIEAGLRSGDLKMPEEINRLVTDRLSDLLFTPDKISNTNLEREGVEKEKIKFVGNIMIDTLEDFVKIASELTLASIIDKNSVSKKIINQSAYPEVEKFAVVTLHRPSNVDDISIITPIIDFIVDEVSQDLHVVWPIHPRTKKQLEKFGLLDKILSCDSLILLSPVNYLEMLRLNMSAKVMLTDSGGLQEECTILGTPCLTLRWNTERPVTLTKYGGASVLVGNDIKIIKEEYTNLLKKSRNPFRPELWDGKTAERIVQELVNYK